MTKLALSVRLAVALTTLSLSLAVAAASNAVAAPPPCTSCSSWWQVEVNAAPSDLPIGGVGTVDVAAINVGNGSITAATPVTIEDVLPQGLTATAIRGVAGNSGNLQGEVECAALPAIICTWSGPGKLHTGERIELEISVNVETTTESTLQDEYTVSGGETPAVSGTSGLDTSNSPTPFGIHDYALSSEREGGAAQTQAGAHPYQLTTTLELNQTTEFNEFVGRTLPTVPELVKKAQFALPSGLVGNPSATPQCTEVEFGDLFNDLNQCPSDTAIGTASIRVNEPYIVQLFSRVVPVFNLVPEKGEPARFGFEVAGIPVVLDTSVRTGTDYGVNVTLRSANQDAAILSSVVTLWGTPGDPSHDDARGWGCMEGGRYESLSGVEPCATTHGSATPFLTLPTSCDGTLQSSVAAESWQGDAPAASIASLQNPQGEALGLAGCDRLSLNPSLSVVPEQREAHVPSGYDVNVHIPQETGEGAEGIVQSTVHDVVVALPAGVQLDPSGANGLVACSLAQAGFIGALNIQNFSPDPTGCPEQSKVGTVEIKTPLLPNPLTGSLYVAAQTANPFGGLLALYLLAEDPVSGVRVKLAGHVELNESTGQIVTTFQDTPELPFEDLDVHIFGGPRAPLATPAGCATYTSVASFTPWSAGAAATRQSEFSSGAVPGVGCAPASFSPTVQAGSVDDQADAFTPFSFVISKPDQSEALGTVTIHMPPGLVGSLKDVPLCPEPAASSGACSAQSLIGGVSVEAGLGPEPYLVQGGKVFLTGPYKGAPFGLTIVTEAKAGPFDLGPVIVRAAVSVDPVTAAVTVVSDPLPKMLQGIPLDLGQVKVTIDRSGGFIFNPTNCSKLAIAGDVSSAAGSTAAFSEPFSAVNCSRLTFAPRLSFTATGKTSRADGAGLKVTIRTPNGPGGTSANLAAIKVDLPKQLPSRQPTLRHACLATVFESDLSKCSKIADVGSAKVQTPVLPVPLQGDIYLVSHGGEAFPDLVMVLHGYGIVLDLTGHIHIKNGITSTAFKSVPDVPVTAVELNFPKGPNGILGAFGSLCKSTLHVPVSLQGANGIQLSRNEKLAVTGCPKKHAKSTHKASKKTK